MSASPYGNAFGRNSGQRGRMDNRNRLRGQALNAKQYVEKFKPMPYRYEMEIDTEPKEKQEEKPSKYLTHGQVVEHNRLKRKNDDFKYLYQKEFIKRQKKEEIKKKMKEDFRKLGKELKTLKQRQQQQQQQQTESAPSEQAQPQQQ
jgi:hypothetical protein